MLLIVKIVSLQSVKVGSQSSLFYSLVLLPYSISLTLIPLVTLVSLLLFISNHHTFGYSGFFITLLLRFLYYPLLTLFLFFFPLNLTYLLITKDYRKRKTLMSLSLDIPISVLPPSIIFDFPIYHIILDK
jgi:hypothetical protein